MNGRWMRIIGCVAVILSLVAIGVGSAGAANCPVKAPSDLVEAGMLTVGTALDSPPMGFMGPNATPAGFDVDLARTLADTMCLKPKFLNLTFQGLFPALNAKKFDIISARVGITEKRKEAFDFVPDFVGGLRLIAKKSSGLWFKTEQDVCGYNTSLPAGSTELAALERVKDKCPPNRPMTMKLFPGNNEALEQLRKGTTTVAFIDWPIAAYAIQQTPGMFAEASPIVSGDGPGTPRHRNGIVIRKDDTAMKTAVEQAMKLVQSNGTYQKILAKYNLAAGDVTKEK